MTFADFCMLLATILFFAGIAWLFFIAICTTPGNEKRMMARLHKRFDNNPMVSTIARILYANDYRYYDYSYGGIQVYTDHITVNKRNYRYADYGLSKLTLTDCKHLAMYFGDLLPCDKWYKVTSIESSSYSDSPVYYYETPGGHLASGGGGDYSEHTIGYQVYVTDPPQQKKPPVTKKW